MLNTPTGLLSPKSSAVDNSFKLTIDTSLGAGTTFTLPLPSGETYDFWWDPGDRSSDIHVTSYNDANITYDYGVAFNGQISIGTHPGDKCGGWSFNNGGDKLKITSVDQLGSVGFDTLERAFYGCNNLTSINAEGSDLTGCISLNGFARNCPSLTSLLTSGWVVSDVEDFGGFITNSTALTSLDCSSWDTSSATTFRAFAELAINLATLTTSGWGTSNVTDFYAFIRRTDVTELDVTSWDMSNVTGLELFAERCRDLTSIDTSGWVLSSNPNCYQSFYLCDALTSYFNPDVWWNYTPAITNHSYTFYGATSISNYASIPNEWKGL